MTNREECPLRNEHNICLCAGDFCLAVNDKLCQPIRQAYTWGVIQGKALSLRKPRVMTAQDWEANRAETMPVWVEWSESAKGECADNGKADGWAILNIDGFVDVLCFGGRCWTSQPTNEQRATTPWEPPKEEIQ